MSEYCVGPLCCICVGTCSGGDVFLPITGELPSRGLIPQAVIVLCFVVLGWFALVRLVENISFVLLYPQGLRVHHQHIKKYLDMKSS